MTAEATRRIGIGNLNRANYGYAGGGYVLPRMQAPANDTRVHVTVGVSADNNGNLKPFVESVSQEQSRKVVSAGLDQYDKTLNRSFGARMTQAQGRQL